MTEQQSHRNNLTLMLVIAEGKAGFGSVSQTLDGSVRAGAVKPQVPCALILVKVSPCFN